MNLSRHGEELPSAYGGARTSRMFASAASSTFQKHEPQDSSPQCILCASGSIDAQIKANQSPAFYGRVAGVREIVIMWRNCAMVWALRSWTVFSKTGNAIGIENGRFRERWRENPAGRDAVRTFSTAPWPLRSGTVQRVSLRPPASSGRASCPPTASLDRTAWASAEIA